jgi:NUMOD4 motif/HNH endonuclease
MGTIETWKDIEGYEGLYQVSDLGRVKSLARVTRHGRKKQEIILRNILERNGYLTVELFKNSVGKKFGVHRLVAMVFISNPQSKREVNHLNGIKNNNFANNLEWSTSSENKLHAIATGLRISIKGSDIWNCKLTESDVLEIRKRLANGERTVDIANIYGVTTKVIGGIKRRQTWKHI